MGRKKNTKATSARSKIDASTSGGPSPEPAMDAPTEVRATPTPMGAISLPSPGNACGPCAQACEHPPCAAVRALAERACRICGGPNGYQIAIYAYPSRCGHADCIDDSHERAIREFIRALAHLFADAWLAGKLPAQPEEPVPDVSQLIPRTNGDEPLSTRYMLPEFDIDIIIPASGRRRGQTPNA